MRRRIQQCLVLVLTVELDQPRRQILQRARGGEPVVDEGATAALRRDFAANQQFLAAGFEDGFDERALFAGPDEVAGRAAAEQEADRLDENRLPRAGLAGQDVQAGLELDLDRVDDGEMLDAEKSEHGETRTPILT